MAIRMIAARRLYLKDEGKELENGASFTVKTDREADRLVRLNRATRVGQEAKVVQAPLRQPQSEPPNLLSTAAMKAEDAGQADAPAPPRRYRRRDLQAQD